MSYKGSLLFRGRCKSQRKAGFLAILYPMLIRAHSLLFFPRLVVSYFIYFFPGLVPLSYGYTRVHPSMRVCAHVKASFFTPSKFTKSSQIPLRSFILQDPCIFPTSAVQLWPLLGIIPREYGLMSHHHKYRVAATCSVPFFILHMGLELLSV